MSRFQSFAVFGLALLGLTLSFGRPVIGESPSGFTKDSLETVKKNLAEGKAQLVDVRSLDEWEDGHVCKAILLPLPEIESDQAAKLLAEKLPKDKIIYTYCAAGYRSSEAGKIIARHKFDVRPLKPGFKELVKAGFEKE